MALIRRIDVGSRGEVVAHVLRRKDAGLVKDCSRLRLERYQYGYVPKCHLNWASEEKDKSVEAKLSNGFDSHEISWPRCPDDCPHYEKPSDFHVSAGRDQYEYKSASGGWKTLPKEPPPPAPVLPAPVAAPLLPPERVTPSWLWRNVPISIWVATGGLIVGAFYAGAQAARLEWVRDLLNVTIAAPTTPQVVPPKANVVPLKR